MRIPNSNLSYGLFAFILTICVTPSAFGQELFRDPAVPSTPIVTTSSLPVAMQEGAARITGQIRRLPGDGFVPEAAPETRLRPVLPRIQTGAPQTQGEIPFRDNRYPIGQPIVPGRTDLREILENSLKEPDAEQAEVRGPEIVQQRYPDGKIQLMKEVLQDKAGNYYNHGDWKLFNRNGQVLAEGQFFEGVMDGLWQRWHPSNAGGIFSTFPFNQFKGPFLSKATFAKGELDGTWTLRDHFERKIFEIPYVNGVRNGTATWWLPNGIRMREVIFKDGIIDGKILEWDKENNLVRQDEFINGKKIVRQTSFYRPRQKQDENFFLDGKLILEGKDDWWQARPANFKTQGERVQHGPAFSWYDNGQPKMKGQYLNNMRLGNFTWWHRNGQKALQGKYNSRGQKIGLWTWWHANGIKSIQGEYVDDAPTGDWVWWETSGKVSKRENMDADAAPATDAETENQNETTNTDSDAETPSTIPPESILVKPDDFDGLEEIFGDGTIDVLPEKNQSEDASDSNEQDGASKESSQVDTE